MKTLIIIRHGKSSWDFNNISDIDRPLKPRGVNNSYSNARVLFSKGSIPDLYLSSPAARALHTANIFLRTLGDSFDKLKITENLYLRDEDELIEIIKTVDDKLNTLAVFGHNPGFTNLANYFSKDFYDNIPTAGMVLLRFNVDRWNEIDRENLLEEEMIRPKK
jgi:phosphohistidine phosphatase